MAYNSINKEGYAVQETTAILSHELLDDHQYTVFAFGGVVLRFRAPDCLQAYTEVKEWDNGYLVVMAKNSRLKSTSTCCPSWRISAWTRRGF